MDNDAAFLRAIADNRRDDSVRLMYADWLEEHGDSRAEFLRLQETLRECPSGESEFPSLCAREHQLLAQLNPVWLQRVRRYTTTAPCRDLLAGVPLLKELQRTTVRLHPHRAEERLPVFESKIGGRFLWPAAEPWPHCADCDKHLAPILQLRKRDAPNLTFPDDTDLLQLFWCPDEVAHNHRPAT